MALCLIKATFNEGVSLFASFTMLLNFQRFGKMKGMGKVVEWSIRDETMHVEGVTSLFRALVTEHSYLNADGSLIEPAQEMAKQAVILEDRFVELAFAIGDMEGLTASDVKQYNRYITDRRLKQLGLPEVFKIEKNPIPWLEWIINAADHTNFFENRVTEYAVAGLTGEWEDIY